MNRNVETWQVGAGAAALSLLSGLLGPDNEESIQYFENTQQPPFAPPAWVFAPAWLVWKTFAVRADTALLNTVELDDDERRQLLALRAVDWLLFNTTQTIGVRFRARRLGVAWAAGQLAATATVIARTRSSVPEAAKNLTPQLAWLTYALPVSIGQAVLQSDD